MQQKCSRHNVEKREYRQEQRTKKQCKSGKENRKTQSWTRRLISNLRLKVETEHVIHNYFLAQILADHGFCKEFTQKVGKEQNSCCEYCGESVSQEHTIFKCPRWGRIRLVMGDRPTPTNIVSLMSEKKVNWEALATLLIALMTNEDVKKSFPEIKYHCFLGP